ncbi:MAG: DUF1987 domain-containing protein [Defluviitaleaceae bacterium]|nr:DUF1987 domain-containing protein [Defluviitaleaceae bacterium]
MEMKIELPKTESTPYVLLDAEKSYMTFKGECYSENTIDFFRNITVWLTDFLASGFTELDFDCELEYFNSSSSKLLYNVLLAMDESAAKGKKININWYVDKGNDVIIEHGEDFKDEFKNVNFTIIEKL